MAVVENGTYAVQASEVAMVYKTDIEAVPPDTPASYLLTVIPKNIGKPQSPQLRFEDQGPRDEFYKKLVEAMGA